MSRLEFFVPGVPQPGGSKRGFNNPKTGRVIITDANPKAASWKDTVSSYALKVPMNREEFSRGPIQVVCTFVMPRPRSHYGTGKNAGKLKPNAPFYHTSKPDSTKLFRSTEDALTGVIWKDDAQVMSMLRKIYGEMPGAYITIYPLEDPPCAN